MKPWAWLLVLAVLAVLSGVMAFVDFGGSGASSTINSFDECVAAGNPVAESMPRTCRTSDGRIFTEALTNQAGTNQTVFVQTDDIIIKTPITSASVASPLYVRGDARGSWFFEGEFQVQLISNGQIIASGTATASSDWMTEEMVPFSGTLRFSVPAEVAGTIKFVKANPQGSDTPESVEFPVTIAGAAAE